MTRPPPPKAPPIARLPLGQTLVELLLGGAVAVAVSLGLQLAVDRMAVGPGTYVLQSLANVTGAVILVGLFVPVGLGWAARWPLWCNLAGAWTGLSALATVLLAIPLEATKFFLGGSGVDNTFRLQYMERMASTVGLADANYRGLAAYYPGGWFWLGGRFANLVGLDGWAAYKPYSITWAGLSAVVAFVLWSLVLRRNRALLVTVVTVLAGFIAFGPDEPYAWPTTAWLPPVALLAWRVFRRGARVFTWPLVLVGGYLGVCAVTYTLHLVFGAVVVVVLAVLAGVLDLRAGAPPWPTVWWLSSRLVVIGVLAALVGALTWGPFILAGGLGTSNVAAHFLPEVGASLPTPFVPTSAFGVLCLGGLVWLVWRARDELATVLLVITGAVYAWFVLSTLAIVANTTLLAFRFIVTVDVALAVAGVFAALDVLRRLPVVSVRAIGVVLAVAGAVSMMQAGVDSSKGMVAAAESDYDTDGYNAKGEHDLALDAAWRGALITTIDELSRRPPTENVVLSTEERLLSFRPYWGFQTTTPHYANPLAAYPQRNEEIRRWASSSGPDELSARMARSPYEPPNVLVLRRGPEGKLLLRVASDSFPRAAPVRVEELEFDPGLFESPPFVEQDVGPFVVIVRR
ncbi:arabinofuranosyltransferase [Pseudonocardia acaciae]|uniref:arabinofuranosyltransferase n=1 Tax=Pseudonocardia acaciae TaxID=551276 RepID=UPI00048F42A0|nr:arabinofuranosyltransferase [Pseudonocardia acaciae]